MTKIDGYKYEELCANYLRRHGYKDVEVTRASGDQGVDIKARKRRHWYGIQCKYYTTPVGNKAVQQAYTGAAFYGCDRAMVITNSYFTDSAEELAENTGVELMEWMQPRRNTLRKAPPPLPKTKKKFLIAAIAVLIVLTITALLLYMKYQELFVFVKFLKI